MPSNTYVTVRCWGWMVVLTRGLFGAVAVRCPFGLVGVLSG